MGIVAEPKIYGCEEWGARTPVHGFSSTTPRLVIWHHMAWPNRPLLADHGAAIMRAFEIARQCQADHMDGNGWADTGQSFTITREGIVLEGRHGALAAARAGHCIRGAHAADLSTGADANNDWGIEHEGTYTAEPMPQPQWDATIHLTAWLCQQTRLDSAMLRGHRDTGCRTACPGDWLESQLAKARAQVHNLKLNGTIVSQPSTALTEGAHPMGITIKTSGAHIIQPSTPGQADGVVRILLDVGRVANTDVVVTALTALPQIQHPGNLFGELALITGLLAAITQHGGGGS